MEDQNQQKEQTKPKTHSKLNLKNQLHQICSRLEKLEDNYTKHEAKANQNIGSILVQWLSTFSGHGFSNLINAKESMIKFLWSLIILGSVSLCFFFIVTSLQQYLEFEVITNIKVKKIEETIFPAVTLCDHENLKIEYIQTKFDSVLYNFTDIFDEITVLYYGVYITCFQFNGKKIGSDKRLRTSHKFGLDYGLNLILRNADHIHYYIGANTFQPIDQYLSNAISTGRMTGITFHKTVSKALGQPYNNCIKNGESFDSDLFMEKMNSGFTYRRATCYNLCFEKTLRKTCPLSEFIHRSNCYTNLTNVFNYTKSCLLFCPIECDSVIYSLKTSVIPFTLGFKKLNPTLANENVTWVAIYMNDLEYTEIEQIPKMTVTDLVSNIGGTLGLFLGLSFMSFMEIFELIASVGCFMSGKKN